MSTRLILIRHGETDWSREKRYCGVTDVDVNPKGIVQAQGLCRKLCKEKVDRVYSSDSVRALNFAKVTFKSSFIIQMSELREMDFGIFEGMAYEEIMKKYPDIYTRWIDDPFSVNVPEGEGLMDFKKRIEDILTRIISLNKDRTAAIVTHGGPIRIIIGNMLNSKNIWTINPDLASLSIIEFKNNTGKIQLFNDRSYLDG